MFDDEDDFRFDEELNISLASQEEEEEQAIAEAYPEGPERQKALEHLALDRSYEQQINELETDLSDRSLTRAEVRHIQNEISKVRGEYQNKLRALNEKYRTEEDEEDVAL